MLRKMLQLRKCAEHHFYLKVPHTVVSNYLGYIGAPPLYVLRVALPPNHANSPQTILYVKCIYSAQAVCLLLQSGKSQGAAVF